jgi:hypothetical protein
MVHVLLAYRSTWPILYRKSLSFAGRTTRFRFSGFVSQVLDSNTARSPEALGVTAHNSIHLVVSSHEKEGLDVRCQSDANAGKR